MDALTKKQIALVGVSACLLVAVGVGIGQATARRAPQIVGGAFGKGAARAIILFVPGDVASAPVVTCNTDMPGDCTKTILSAVDDGWVPVPRGAE